MPYEAVNKASRMPKRQERVQSRWREVITWECSLSVWSLEAKIKTPLSSGEKKGGILRGYCEDKQAEQECWALGYARG